MKALLVVDIQKSYISRYDHNLLPKINERILEAEKSHWVIVYIKNTKRLRNRTLTEEFADGLAVLSDNVFHKNSFLPYIGRLILLFPIELYIPLCDKSIRQIPLKKSKI